MCQADFSRMGVTAKVNVTQQSKATHFTTEYAGQISSAHVIVMPEPIFTRNLNITAIQNSLTYVYVYLSCMCRFVPYVTILCVVVP